MYVRTVPNHNALRWEYKMGAGCYYTLPDNREIKAYWLEVASDESTPEDFSDAVQYEHEYLQELITELPLAGVYDGVLYYGKHYRINLESTYNGDGILINLVIDLPEYDRLYPLTLANLERVYTRIIKHVNKSTALRIASSGYMSEAVPVGGVML